ncbi:hypothetical protein NPIL_474711 [Nephila pilipes]|uniref:Uncharacterized protein n=1 Tax=Nephila pilipes TaxID=299642 RepID=A0A8X6TBL5_NEPPI|nr:hypothetical protein NPIL_474711 [Nephila pilipes]
MFSSPLKNEKCQQVIHSEVLSTWGESEAVRGSRHDRRFSVGKASEQDMECACSIEALLRSPVCAEQPADDE